MFIWRSDVREYLGTSGYLLEGPTSDAIKNLLLEFLSQPRYAML